MTDPDERLLVEAAQLDLSRFAELYDRHFERVFAFVIRRVRIAMRPRSHRERLSPRPGASAVVRVARRAVRRLADPHRRECVVDRARRAGREVVDSDALPDTGALPADDLERAEESARLFRLVDALPDDQRAVIVDRFVEDRSIRETAERLGRSEGAIKQLQHRALETLRRRLRAPAEDGDA
jgi:RNA polymerase sigma-70 factor (ECF subfamily)